MIPHWLISKLFLTTDHSTPVPQHSTDSFEHGVCYWTGLKPSCVLGSLEERHLTQEIGFKEISKKKTPAHINQPSRISHAVCLGIRLTWNGLHVPQTQNFSNSFSDLRNAVSVNDNDSLQQGNTAGVLFHSKAHDWVLFKCWLEVMLQEVACSKVIQPRPSKFHNSENWYFLRQYSKASWKLF